MGFFKKSRPGGKTDPGVKKGGGIKGKEASLGGYSLYSHEKESGANTKPITKKAGSELNK